jgi:peptide/nickel transport system permease protein
MTAQISTAPAAGIDRGGDGRVAARPSPGGGQADSILRFLAQRLARLVGSVFVLVTATFFMIQAIPGNPAAITLGQQATRQLVRLRTRQLGLDKPLAAQYWHYLTGVVSGHLGSSLIAAEPVSSILSARTPPTLALAIPAFVIVLLLSVPAGFFMALRTQGGRGEMSRLAFVTATGVGNSTPDFVWATLFSVVFVVALKLFPVAGDTGFLSHVLPVAALCIGPAATLSRIVRVEALKVLDSDYVLAARGRRLPRWLLYFRHVLPNMLTAALTYGGMVFAGLIAGTVLVENVFAWPGLGTEVVQAVVDKDYPVIQGILLVLGTICLVTQLLVDVVRGFLDPRSRIRQS